jgi:hypothetical protein
MVETVLRVHNTALFCVTSPAATAWGKTRPGTGGKVGTPTNARCALKVDQPAKTKTKALQKVKAKKSALPHRWRTVRSAAGSWATDVDC